MEVSVLWRRGVLLKMSSLEDFQVQEISYFSWGLKLHFGFWVEIGNKSSHQVIFTNCNIRKNNYSLILIHCTVLISIIILLLCFYYIFCKRCKWRHVGCSKPLTPVQHIVWYHIQRAVTRLWKSLGHIMPRNKATCPFQKQFILKSILLCLWLSYQSVKSLQVPSEFSFPRGIF